MIDVIMALFASRIILSAAVSCLAAQLIKFFVDMIRNRRPDFVRLIDVGGMPSAHAAVVSSMVVSVYILEGITPLFAIVFILAIIIIRDALGVRMTVQKQSSILRRLTPDAAILRSAEGHNFNEIVVGMIVGILVSIAVGLI